MAVGIVFRSRVCQTLVYLFTTQFEQHEQMRPYKFIGQLRRKMDKSLL